MCLQTTECSTCSGSGQCFIPYGFNKFFVAEYGQIYHKNLAQQNHLMMAELYARGPIVCDFACSDDFVYNYKGGIYEDTTGFMDIDHLVSVSGWGEEKGKPFWHVRNTWGVHWGEDGWFRIVRGKNNLAIEHQCTWAVANHSNFDDWKFEQYLKKQSK